MIRGNRAFRQRIEGGHPEIVEHLIVENLGCTYSEISADTNASTFSMIPVSPQSYETRFPLISVVFCDVGRYSRDNDAQKIVVKQELEFGMHASDAKRTESFQFRINKLDPFLIFSKWTILIINFGLSV